MPEPFPTRDMYATTCRTHPKSRTDLNPTKLTQAVNNPACAISLARTIHSYLCEIGLEHLATTKRLADCIRNGENGELGAEDHTFIDQVHTQWLQIMNEPNPCRGADPRRRVSKWQ